MTPAEDASPHRPGRPPVDATLPRGSENGRVALCFSPPRAEEELVTTTLRPLLLGGYAAKRCPRATHNEFDPGIDRPEWAPDAAAEERMAAGRTFEDDVVPALLQALPGAVDLREYDGNKAAHIQATLDQLAAGSRLIVGGQLPDDVPGARVGKPDLLIRAEDRPDGRPGYHVGDIKHHLSTVRAAGGTALVSTPAAPELHHAGERDGVQLKWREDDCIQLAHYWRMLQACGFSAAEPWGAVLGTDGPSGYIADELGFVWHALDEQVFSTYSRSAGKAWRSSLDRYDHEHAFRVDVADAARRRTADGQGPEPLVLPIGHKECGDCEWAAACVDTLPDDDLSNELRADLSIREYLTLRTAGITTVADLAVADADELLTDEYHGETAHLAQRARRLRKARLNAELAVAGVAIRLRDDAPAVPSVDVGYDVDCEWSADGFVYLWGVLRTEGDTSEYVPFLDLAVADDEAEYALTAKFLQWLDGQVRTDHEMGRTTAIYHYSSAELIRLKRVTSAVGRPLPTLCEEASPEAWVDLLPVVQNSVESRWGCGLKIVATYGAGFEWRDDEPGGLQSQVWREEALAGDAAAAQRILEYNEDDVRATIRTRSWLCE